MPEQARQHYHDRSTSAAIRVAEPATNQKEN
jgi:hypothetical protein